MTPLALDFGPIRVGGVSDTRTVTITNHSLLDSLTGWAGGGLVAPFTASQDCAPSVPARGACRYSFTFQPTSAGSFTAQSISSTSAGQFTITVHGTGVGPAVTASPLSVDFGPQMLGITTQ